MVVLAFFEDLDAAFDGRGVAGAEVTGDALVGSPP